MKAKETPSHQERLIEEIEAKQRNTVWPDTLRNGSSVDEFLWKGSSNAPLVQRIGAWIFGLTFMLLGAGLIEIDRESTPERKSLLPVICGVLVIMLGVRIFLNGFRKRRDKKSSTESD
jgi:cytochrome c biogenesis protein CcdA